MASHMPRTHLHKIEFFGEFDKKKNYEISPLLQILIRMDLDQEVMKQAKMKKFLKKIQFN